MKKISILDYGLGNLHSIARAFEYCEHSSVKIIKSYREIEAADFLVLPGVGAFPSAMEAIGRNGLIDALESYVERSKPLMGICLGMQILASYGEEYGRCQGLNFLPGRVSSLNSHSVKIPNIGWRDITYINKDNPAINIFNKVCLSDSVYMVHSYEFLPDNRDNILAYTNYNGKNIVSAVGIHNLVGCQFHPEKSGEIGLKILKNFTKL